MMLGADRAAAGVVLVVAALVLAACGGSGGQGPSARDAYLAKADARCAEVNTRFGQDLRLARPTLFPFADGDEEVLLDRADALLQTFKRLRSLDVPAEDRPVITPWLALMGRYVRSAVDLADDYRRTRSDELDAGDIAIVGLRVLSHDRAAIDAGKAAEGVGLRDCARFKTWQVTPRDRVRFPRRLPGE